jgi:hypothetical protein
MSKYDRLADFLREQKTQEIPVTFKEIERVVGTSLPASSRYPAWWSNNPSNNVMTKIWLDAGYRTEQVDIGARKLVFRRARTENTDNFSRHNARAFSEPGRSFSHTHPIRGALKGLLRFVGSADMTKPADPDWADK